MKYLVKSKIKNNHVHAEALKSTERIVVNVLFFKIGDLSGHVSIEIL